MATKRKADHTPEEWAAHLQKVRQWRLDNLDRWRATHRAYEMRPEVRAKRLARYNTPEAKAKKKAYHAQESVKQKHRELYARKTKDPAWRAKVNASQRRRRTGFNDEAVSALLTIQEHKCAVCKSPISGHNIKRDHCHTTGTPRGLLCHHCNIIEGMLLGMGLSALEFGQLLHEYICNPPFQKLSSR